jgi:hypothetical protein
MKRTLLIGVCMVFCASLAFAQNGSIMVFSDGADPLVDPADCNFADVGGLVQVHIWHMYSPGTTASEWMLETPGYSHLGDQPEFQLVIGTSISGVSLSYEACYADNFKLMTVNFFGNAAPSCSLVRIVAAPGKAGVRSVDCAENSVLIAGGEGRVNPDGTCTCAVPVEETTWGNIKALYN